MQEASADSTKPFTIGPAHPDDVPRLARIHSAAFKQDAFVQLMFDFDDARQEAAISDALETQLARPAAFTVVKAVVNPTGQIAGWMAFKSDVDRPQPEESGTAAVDADEEHERPETLKVDSELVKTARAQGEAVRTSYFNARGIRDYVFLITLVVDPDCKGRGIGGALVRYCNAHADREGLPIWLRASEVAYPLYTRNGFERVDEVCTAWSEWLDGGVLERVKAIAKAETQSAIYMFRPVQGTRVDGGRVGG